jgi:aminomethyltransferase
MSIKSTALLSVHEKLGARIVDFAGYRMPLQYTSILEEHHAVRTAAGVFDVSHMGEFLVSGAGVRAFLDSA